MKWRIGDYRIEYVDNRYSVIGRDRLVVSTHPTLDDAVLAVERYIAGNKRRASDEKIQGSAVGRGGV